MARLGIITGLASEADCLKRFPAGEAPVVRCAGADAARAAAAARELVSQGCDGLLSFGMAGGLDAGAGAGTLIIADTAIAPDGQRYGTDTAWRRAVVGRISGAGITAMEGSIAGSAQVVTTTEGKRNLRGSTGALAVDMESHAIAAAARSADVPFLALRVIADPVTRAIPQWVMKAVLDDGGIDPTAIIRPLLARPWMVWTLIGLAQDNGKALAALRRVATLLGFRFGLDLR